MHNAPKPFARIFAQWKQRAAALNTQLKPIVNKPIDVNDPNWEEQIERCQHPADASGLRQEIETLFEEIIDRFEICSPAQREQIVDVMYKNQALRYSAVINADPSTPEGFRRAMILFVIEDQGTDTRDAILALSANHAKAEKQGIDVKTIFKDMAGIASTRDKFGWGTTRDLFLKYLK